MTQDKIRPADCPIVIGSATEAGPMAKEVVLNFVMNKWAVLKQRFSGQFLLPKIIDVSLSILFIPYNSMPTPDYVSIQVQSICCIICLWYMSSL